MDKCSHVPLCASCDHELPATFANIYVNTHKGYLRNLTLKGYKKEFAKRLIMYSQECLRGNQLFYAIYLFKSIYYIEMICVTVFFFFFWHGSARRASGCQKGAAEEPLRGCLNFKP